MVVVSKRTGKRYVVNLETVTNRITKENESKYYPIVVGIAVILAALVVRG